MANRASLLRQTKKRIQNHTRSTDDEWATISRRHCSGSLARIAFRARHSYDQVMPTQKRRPPPASGGGSSAASLLQQRSLELPVGAAFPRVSLRSVRLHPHLFRK